MEEEIDVTIDPTTPPLPKGYDPIKKSAKDAPALPPGYEPLKKKAPSTSIVQKKELVLEPTTGSSGGRNTEMQKFTGLSGADLKSLESAKKPLPKINKKLKEYIDVNSDNVKRRKELEKELKTVTVTPENQEDISAKTDELAKLNQQSQENIKASKERSEQKQNYSKISSLTNKFLTGSSQLGADMAAIPELVYDVFAIPQNAIADIFDAPSLRTDSEKFKQTIGVNNAVKDFYKKEVLGLRQKAQETDLKYVDGIYDSFVQGDYAGGFDQLTNSFAESFPATTTIMVGGAAMKAPQLMAASSMMFGAGKNEKLKEENPEMNNNSRVANALATGFIQGATETLGTGSIGAAAKGLIEREGTKKATTILKDGLVNYYKSALEKNPMLASMSGEGLEEAFQGVAENAVDVATGVKPQDYNIYQNAVDDFIGGAFGGAVFGAGLKGLQQVTNYQDKNQIKSNTKKVFNLQNELQNPELSPESKIEIDKTIDSLVKTNQKLVQKNVDHVESLSPKVREELIKAIDITELTKEKAAQIKIDPNTSNETKQILLDNLSKEYNAANERKTKILEGSVSEVDVLPLKEQDKLKREALKELTQELNPEGKKNIEITNEQITERANKNYLNQIKDAEKSETIDSGNTETKPQAEIQKPANAADEIQEVVEESGNKESIKGTLENNKYTLNNGEQYNIKMFDGINGEVDSFDNRENKDRASFSVHNDKGESVATITFWKDKDGKFYSNNTNVNKEYRRKGIATAVYNYAESLGIDIKPSDTQTQMGKSFFDTRQKRKEDVGYNPENIIKEENFDYKTGESTVVLEDKPKTNETISESNSAGNGGVRARIEPVDEVRTAEQENIIEKPVPETIDTKPSEEEVEVKKQQEVNPEKIKIEEFRDKIKELPHSGEFSKYASGETIEKVEGETPRNDQGIEVSLLKDVGQHGKETVEKAKEVFGDKYVEKTLEYLDEANLKPHEKAVLYVSLENEMYNRLKDNPDNISDKKLQDLVREKSQAHLREASLGINAGRLRAFMKEGYVPESLTNKIFSEKQLSDKNKLEKSIQANADEINKEAEALEQSKEGIEDGNKPKAIYTQDDFDRELQKAKDELGNDYNISVFENLKRQAKKDKLSDKKEELQASKKDILDQIRKLANKQANTLSSIPVPLEAVPLITKLAKVLIQEGAVDLESVVDDIHNTLKDIYKDISKKDIASILKSKPKKVMSEATNRKIYINLLNKKIASLDAQIEAKKHDVTTREDKYKNDAEIKELRDKRTEKREELAKIDPSYAESRKLATDLKLAQKSLDEYQRRIDENDLTSKEKDPKVVNDKLKKLREARDVKKKEFLSKKKKYDESLKDATTTPKEKVKAQTNNPSLIEAKKLSTAKNKVKELLIDAGFGREINVIVNEKDENGNILLNEDGKPNKTKEKRSILDWKKLAGPQGSIDVIRKNVEESLNKKGYSKDEIKKISKEYEKEYNNLRSNIIEKSINELVRRNAPKKKIDIKSTSKRLAELYNYGLFEKETDTYNNLVNSALGLNDLDQKAFTYLESLAKSLADLYATGYSETALSPAISNVNKKIARTLASVAFTQSNSAFKVANVVSEYINLSQRFLLVTLGQLIDNPVSGKVQRIISKLGYVLDKTDNKALEAQRKKISKERFKSIVRDAGDAYGDSSSLLINESRVENWLNNKTDSKIQHSIISFYMGRAFLEGFDSRHKTVLTEKYFVHNLIKVLSDKSNPNAMSKEKALEFVTEKLTGESFEEAKSKAKKITDKINEDAGKKILSDNERSINIFAQEIMKDSLLSGEKLSKEQLEASYNASYKSAGKDIGHVANNPISESVGSLSASTSRRLDKAIKDKNWNLAALYTMEQVLTRNIMNTFVGGGTNWMVIGAQKSGLLGLPFVVIDAVKRSGKKIDLTTEEGMKNLENVLEKTMTFKNTANRVFIGSMSALIVCSLAISSGADDDLNSWLKKNKWAKKWFDKLAPSYLVALLAYENNELGRYFEKLLGVKPEIFNDTKNLAKSFGELADPDNKNKGGSLGKIIGNKLNAPAPVKMAQDIRDIYRVIAKKPPIDKKYKASSFWNGYFQGGLVDYLGFRPGPDAVEKSKNKKDPGGPDLPSPPKPPSPN